MLHHSAESFYVCGTSDCKVTYVEYQIVTRGDHWVIPGYVRYYRVIPGYLRYVTVRNFRSLTENLTKRSVSSKAKFILKAQPISNPEPIARSSFLRIAGRGGGMSGISV